MEVLKFCKLFGNLRVLLALGLIRSQLLHGAAVAWGAAAEQQS
jgi:hypothetical protein